MTLFLVILEEKHPNFMKKDTILVKIRQYLHVFSGYLPMQTM